MEKFSELSTWVTPSIVIEYYIPFGIDLFAFLLLLHRRSILKKADHSIETNSSCSLLTKIVLVLIWMLFSSPLSILIIVRGKEINQEL